MTTSNTERELYYGTVRHLLNVHARRSVYGPRGPVLITGPRRTGISRFTVSVDAKLRGSSRMASTMLSGCKGLDVVCTAPDSTYSV